MLITIGSLAEHLLEDIVTTKSPRSCSALPAVSHHDLLGGLARLGAEGLNLLHNVHATVDNRTEDDMLSIQMLGLGSAQEELGAVGVRAGVGHRQDSRSGVLQGEVLVLELVAIDGLASGAVSSGEVTSLAHEAGNDPVEAGSLESKTLLSSAESTEVLRSLRHDVRTELHDHPTEGGTIGGDVEEDAKSSHDAGMGR